MALDSVLKLSLCLSLFVRNCPLKCPRRNLQNETYCHGQAQTKTPETVWGVLFVFLFRKPIGIHNSLHHNIHIILCQLAAGKQTSYFICELLRLFGTSCAVLLRSLSNEHTIRTQKLIHGNIKCLCQLLRCIQARTRGSAFVSLYGTGGNTGNLCKLLLRHIIFSLSPFNLSLNFIINSFPTISIFSSTTLWFVKRFRRISKNQGDLVEQINTALRYEQLLCVG